MHKDIFLKSYADKYQKVCVGCGICRTICPHNSISMKLSEDGFYVPEYDSSSCTNCGLCAEVCPIFVNDYQKSGAKSYVYTSDNDHLISSVSSGGFAFDFSKAALKQGYKGCGVIYDNNPGTCKHIIYNSREGLELTKGSKYIPSYTIDAFAEMFTAKEKYVVFGTPCQISGLRNLINMKKVTDRFILVDFFCHGVPSYNLWFKYLDHLKRKYKFEKIEKLSFRAKKYGWHNFTVMYENGGSTYSSDATIDNDLFYKFFLGDFCLNDCCYNCKYKLLKSCADIRMGDCWSHKYAADKRGISGVCALTTLGKDALSIFKLGGALNTEETSVVLEGQMADSPDKDAKVEKIKGLLRSDKTLEYINKNCLTPRTIDRIKQAIKNLIKQALCRS